MAGELPITEKLPVVEPRPDRQFPVIEIFGPTIQGEGPDAGLSCCFVRLGGCDYRCEWCDSMYAVDPAEVREHAMKMTAAQIVSELGANHRRPGLVVLSGGNPALFELGGLTRMLQQNDCRVSVETQGSVWRPWLATVNRLVISPKPPSSGMATQRHQEQTRRFMAQAVSAACDKLAIKIVVFDEDDYEWAMQFHMQHMLAPFYLSAGTPQELPLQGGQPVPAVLHDTEVVQQVLRRYTWLCERTARDSRARDAKVLPQLHVLAWGTARGV